MPRTVLTIKTAKHGGKCTRFHIQNTSKDSYLMGYQTTKTGYCLATTSNTTLTFHSQAKTITCEIFGD